jgi:hypothetical protein
MEVRAKQIAYLKQYMRQFTGDAAKTRVENAIEMIRRVPGVSYLGKDAASDWLVYPRELLRHIRAGGITPLRPLQFLKNITLGRSNDLVAGSRLWRLDGIPEANDPKRFRNIHVAVPFSGQEIDEFGNPIGEVLSATDIMKVGGFHEQQTLVNKRMAKAMGMKSMQGQKVSYHGTKGTVVEAGNGNNIWFEHDKVMALVGVDAPKLIGKHDAGLMFTEGWLNRILTEAGPEDARHAAERLREFMGEGVRFEKLARGMFTIRTSPSARRPTFEQLNTLIDEINARRIGRAAERNEEQQELMKQFDFLVLHKGDRRYRVDFAHLLTSTSVLDDGNPATALKGLARGNHTGKYLPVGPRAQAAKTDAMMIHRVRFAGAPLFADIMAGAAIDQKAKSGIAYRIRQVASALGATFRQTNEQDGIDTVRMYRDMVDKEMVKSVSMAELTDPEGANRLERGQAGMSLAEYEKRYGTGMQSLKLAVPVDPPAGLKNPITGIIMPDEHMNPDEDGYKPTPLNRAADRVIRHNQNVIDAEGDLVAHERAVKGLTRAVAGYHKELGKVLGGGKGLANEFAREINIKGQGVAKAKFGYNMLEDLTYKELNELRARSGLADHGTSRSTGGARRPPARKTGERPGRVAGSQCSPWPRRHRLWRRTARPVGHARRFPHALRDRSLSWDRTPDAE